MNWQSSVGWGLEWWLRMAGIWVDCRTCFSAFSIPLMRWRATGLEISCWPWMLPTAAVEAAFRVGFESPAAASATFRIGARNGREAVIESALEAAWNWLVSNIDEGKDVAFVEVLAFARERCLGVTAEQVRVEFKKRLKERWQSAPRAA